MIYVERFSQNKEHVYNILYKRWHTAYKAEIVYTFRREKYFVYIYCWALFTNLNVYIHCFCIPIMHYKNLKVKTSEKTELYKRCQMSFPHVQPLWVKQSNGFFDPVHQISFQFVRVDLQLSRCAFCLNISPLHPLVSLFFKWRTQFA